jgi:hypothetical protein
MLPEQTNKIVKGLPKAIPIKDLALNISIVDNPVINPDFLSVNIFGIIQRQQETQDCPYLFDPINLPVYTENGKMVTIFAYARIFKCVMWTLQRSGYLDFSFKQADVPGHPEVLNTTTWATVIPQFLKMYPNSATMSIDMSVKDVPDVKITSAKGIIATSKQIIAKLYAREERDYLMTLKFYIKVAATAKLGKTIRLKWV